MPRTGRPREFDADVALEAALRLFWTQGYEATSLAQLRTAMGVSSASFYGAFGSKRGLFTIVLDRYAASYGTVTDAMADAVADDTLDPRRAVELTLRRSARMQTDASHPSGCLFVLAATSVSEAGQQARQDLCERREIVRGNLAHCVRRAIGAGDLAASTDADALASALLSCLWGLSTEACDGVDPAVLDRAITCAMTMWDAARPEPPLL